MSDDLLEKFLGEPSSASQPRRCAGRR